MKLPQKSLIIVLHTAILIAAYSSPFWLDWRIILAGVAVYYLQLLIFGWCVLSLQQFGEKKTFHEWYLGKFGLHPDPRRLRFTLNYVVPPALVLIAIIYQNR